MKHTRLRKMGGARRAYYHRKRDRVVVELNAGIEVAFRPGDAQGLEHAKPDQLDTIEISPSVLGFTSRSWTPTSICRPCWKAF